MEIFFTETFFYRAVSARPCKKPRLAVGGGVNASWGFDRGRTSYLASSASFPFRHLSCRWKRKILRSSHGRRSSQVLEWHAQSAAIQMDHAGPKQGIAPFFLTVLPENFNDCLAVPCYMKDKIDLMYNGVDEMMALTSGGIGHIYSFDISKSSSKTCISGEEWNKFLADFKIEAGDKILFNMTGNVKYPMEITPMGTKCKNKKYSVLDPSVNLAEVYYMHDVVVITRNIEFTAQNKLEWEHAVNERGVGIGPLFVHKLTQTNIKNKMMGVHISNQLIGPRH